MPELPNCPVHALPPSRTVFVAGAHGPVAVRDLPLATCVPQIVLVR